MIAFTKLTGTYFWWSHFLGPDLLQVTESCLGLQLYPNFYSITVVFLLLLRNFLGQLNTQNLQNTPQATAFKVFVFFPVVKKIYKVSSKGSNISILTPFQTSFAFHIETSHLFCSALWQITGFYMKRKSGLKCVNMFTFNREDTKTTSSDIDLFSLLLTLNILLDKSTNFLRWL